jgi:hypothetical protein
MSANPSDEARCILPAGICIHALYISLSQLQELLILCISTNFRFVFLWLALTGYVGFPLLVFGNHVQVHGAFSYCTVNPLYKDTLGTRIPILIERYSYREEHVTRTEKKAYKFPILF